MNFLSHEKESGVGKKEEEEEEGEVLSVWFFSYWGREIEVTLFLSSASIVLKGNNLMLCLVIEKI